MLIQLLQLLVLIIFLKLTSTHINSKLLTYIYSFFSSIFINLQILSLLLIKNFFNYEFFVNINIQGLLLYISDFSSYIFFIFLSLIFVFIFIVKKNKLINLSFFNYLILYILSFFFLLFPNNSIFKNLLTVFNSIQIEDTYDSNVLLKELGIDTKEYVYKDNLNAIAGKNILVISIESLEKDFLFGDYKNLTTNLNQFKDKYYFRDMNQIASWTAGSLYTLMTGLPPYFKKDDLNSQFHGVKNIFSTTLNDVLLKAGYDSKYFMGDVSFAGTNQLLDALRISTISNENNTNFKSPNDSDLFLELKNSLSNRDKNKKFAYFVSTLNTHFPNGIFDENVSSLHKKNILDFNTKLDFQIFSIDYLINDLFDFMKENDLFDDTAIFIFPDHLMMGEGPNNLSFDKRSLYVLSNQEIKQYPDLNQGHLPRLILDSSGIKSNITFFNDFKLRNDHFQKIAMFNYRNLEKSSIDDFVLQIKDNHLHVDYSETKKNIQIDHNTKYVQFIFNANMNLIEIKKEFIYPDLNPKKFNHLDRPIVISLHFDKGEYQNIDITNFANIQTHNQFDIFDKTITLKKEAILELIEKNTDFFNFYFSKLLYYLKYHLIKDKNNDQKNINLDHNPIIENKKSLDEVLIAHGGGEIHGDIYTNSLESINQSYKNGLRFIELDLHLTSDFKIVAVHDWEEWAIKTGYVGELPPSHEIFMSNRYLGSYTPIDIDLINEWFTKNDDAYLVSDKIDKPFLLSNSFFYPERLIMEIFSFDSLLEALKSNISEVVPNVKLWKKLRKARYRDQLDFSKINNIAIPYNYKKRQFIKEIQESGLGFYIYGLKPNKAFTKDFLCSENSSFNRVYVDSSSLINLDCKK